MRGLSLRIFLGLFPESVYPIMVAKKFKIHGVNLTGKFIFHCAPKQNSPPGFYHLHSTTHFSPKTFFEILFSVAEREEDYGAEKMIKIKLARALVTSFDKSHHFITSRFFLVCVSLCHNLYSNMLKCEGFLREKCYFL